MPTVSAFPDRPFSPTRKSLQPILVGFAASLAAMPTVLVVALMLSAQHDALANRIIRDEQQGVGYAATVVRQLAASQGRPRGF